MGLGIHVQDLRRDELKLIGDSVDGSFQRVCSSAPPESLLRGVPPYGLTMFNSVQIRRLIEELESLPAEKKSPKVLEVIEGAHMALRRSGYLYIVGD